MQYFSKCFSNNYILPNVKLPISIQVFTKNREVGKVKMVMNKSRVNGKYKGGAMLTSHWMDVVKHTDMRIGDIFVFWFRGSRDGGLKLLVDPL